MMTQQVRYTIPACHCQISSNITVPTSVQSNLASGNIAAAHPLLHSPSTLQSAGICPQLSTPFPRRDVDFPIKALMPNSLRPLDTTRRSCLCRVWCAGVNWTIALNVFRLQISVGDSIELSGIQFTPPKRTRHRQDSIVVSGLVV